MKYENFEKELCERIEENLKAYMKTHREAGGYLPVSFFFYHGKIDGPNRGKIKLSHEEQDSSWELSQNEQLNGAWNTSQIKTNWFALCQRLPLICD